MALDPELIERFRRDLAALATDGGPITLAVSGGPDSMAMLVLAAEAFPGEVIAATVDHGLRAASADEAEMVARYCDRLSVPHRVLLPTEPIEGASIQAQARAARYALLLDWAAETGATLLLTAHHADDQAETFLMRAARGSGLAGLAAIRARREEPVRDTVVAIVRPLLGWRRAELRTVAKAAGAPFVDDPTNADPAHDRTRFRALLEANPWLDAAAVARSAVHLAEVEAIVRAAADEQWGARVGMEGDAVSLDIGDLPRALRRQLTRDAIGFVRGQAAIDAPAWSDAANIEPLLDALETGKAATQAGVMVTPKGSSWLFRPAPPRRSH